MSYFLRHNLDAFNKVNIDGSVEIKELLALPEFSDVDIAELLYIIATNDKQRFKISEDGLYIRANQGHSISESANLIDADKYSNK
jgi:RNA:NAD 2'-phosphotransferase (TPT1/KptA family)